MTQTINKVDAFNQEYTYLKNKKYRDNIKILVNLLPDYFFEVPASSTGKYHPSFSLGKGGLLRHTKAAVRIALELYHSDPITHKFTSNEKDLMLMALILHDGLKHGMTYNQYTVAEHPQLISKYIQEHKEQLTLTENEILFLCNVIEAHMGPWNTDYQGNVILPIPVNRYQKFVHMCDYLSSRKFLDVKFNENNDIIE